jgi:hypothetical protein
MWAAMLRRCGNGDGFIDTGDMVDCAGGIINVGGQKVNPEEVEAAINCHPAVWASQRSILTVISELSLRGRDHGKMPTKSKSLMQ